MKARPVMRYQAVNWLRPTAAILVFVSTFVIRVRGVSEDFTLLGDQMRDWSIAMKPFGDLPLVGPPTHVGGYTIGPAFYWILWAIRVVLGPFFAFLPHAGGVGQAALQSAADAALMVALWHRTGSPWMAMATVMLVATASFDLNLAALVWNPTMGTALAKLGIAGVLLDWHRRSPVHAAATVAVAWCGVQAYTGAIFVAVGVFAALILDPAVRSERKLVIRNVLVLATIVAALQTPLVAHHIRQGFRDQAIGAVTGSVGEVVSGRQPPQLRKSVRGYVAAFTAIEVAPWRIPAVGWLLLACYGIVAALYFRDTVLLSVTHLPALAAIAGYALFLADLDHYYYLSLMAPAMLVVVLATTAVLSRIVARASTVAVFVAALMLVPGRIRYEQTLPRMPEYRLLVDASRKIRSHGQPMRAIETDFRLPPTGDPAYLFELMGGRMDRTSPWVCLIRSDGTVVYRRITGS